MSKKVLLCIFLVLTLVFILYAPSLSNSNLARTTTPYRPSKFTSGDSQSNFHTSINSTKSIQGVLLVHPPEVVYNAIESIENETGYHSIHGGYILSNGIFFVVHLCNDSTIVSHTSGYEIMYSQLSGNYFYRLNGTDGTINGIANSSGVIHTEIGTTSDNLTALAWLLAGYSAMQEVIYYDGLPGKGGGGHGNPTWAGGNSVSVRFTYSTDTALFTTSVSVTYASTKLIDGTITVGAYYPSVVIEDLDPSIPNANFVSGSIQIYSSQGFDRTCALTGSGDDSFAYSYLHQDDTITTVINADWYGENVWGIWIQYNGSFTYNINVPQLTF